MSQFFQRYRNILLFPLPAILALILISFIIRSPLASWFIRGKAEQFNRQYHADLHIEKVRIIGLASIRVTGISLCKAGSNDTLLKVDTAFIAVGILKLLAGRLSIHDVSLIRTGIHVVEGEKENNFMFLMNRERKRADTLPLKMEYHEMAAKMLRFIFDKIPLSLTIHQFSICHSAPGHEAGFSVDALRLDRHYFRTAISVYEDSLRQRWSLSGRIDNETRMCQFRICADSGSGVTLPYIRQKFGAEIGFDTLAFRFSELAEEDERVSLDGYAILRGLKVDYWRVALQPVIFDRLMADYRINIGPDYAELDSATRIVFNRIDLHPWMKYRPYPSKQFTFSVHKPPFPARDLFSSFPPGLFSNLEGLEVAGQLSWFADFFLDLALPDSLRFETALSRHQFRILSYGNGNLLKMCEPFQHSVWENDQMVRSFEVGPGNPEYRRLDQMSPFLQFAVMATEDGGFYQHRGFLPDAFRESMITNIKERRFARGGSTISMQLIKNVFLNRNKTIARKLEEALIVWLIENQGIVTKERMMEVYLNVIEWGPMIYGANEAAHFYFNKDVSRLTLAEAIFMASVIPRPKWFRYSFDDEGNLRESARDFINLVTQKMLNKGWITSSEAEKSDPGIVLRGRARMMLRGADTLQPSFE
jgi:hypothetical protein